MKYIMLHGLGQSSESWSDTVKVFNDDFEVLCPNLSDWLFGKIQGPASGAMDGWVNAAVHRSPVGNPNRLLGRASIRVDGGVIHTWDGFLGGPDRVCPWEEKRSAGFGSDLFCGHAVGFSSNAPCGDSRGGGVDSGRRGRASAGRT